MIVKSLIVTLLLASRVFAQPTSLVLRGSWTATVGPQQVYRGQWSGQPLPAKPNAWQGSWLVVNDSLQIVLQGTWAAEKSGPGWQGRWSARIVTGREPSGTVISGSWHSAAEGVKSATLADLLQSTRQQQVAGSWRSGSLAGNWWVKGPS